MDNHNFPMGMTVAELKKVVADWPETTENGEPCEVWLGNADGLSSPVTRVGRLNLRSSDDEQLEWADLLLEPNSLSPSRVWVEPLGGKVITPEEAATALICAQDIIGSVGTTGIYDKYKAARDWMRRYFPSYAEPGTW